MRVVVVAVVFLVVGVNVGRGVMPVKPVTNEDIRDAILSVVNMIRSTEDKLERHEYRERALGDQIKKALTTIDKRQKLLDPVKGTLSRIDERLAAVETILMQKDERERIQLEKTNELVDQIQQNLPKMFEKLKSDLLSAITPKADSKLSENELTKSDLENLRKNIDDVCKNVSKNVEQISESNKVHTQLIEKTSKNVEDIKHQIGNNDKNDIQSNILQEIQKQKLNVDQLLSSIKIISNKLPKVAEASDVQAAKNDSLKTIEQNTAKLQKILEDACKSKNDLQPKILQNVEQQKVSVDQILTNIKTISSKIPKVAEVADVQAAKNDAVKAIEHNNAKLQKVLEDAAKTKNDLQPKMLQSLEQQKVSIDNILSHFKTISNKIPKLAEIADILATKNDTLKALEQNNVKLQRAIEDSTKTTNDLQPKIHQSLEQQKLNLDQLLSNIKTMSNKITDEATKQNDVNKSLEQIKKDVAQVNGKLDDARKTSEQNNAKVQKAVECNETKSRNDPQPKILQALENQQKSIDQIISNIKTITSKVPDKIAQVSDVQTALKPLENIKKDLAQQMSTLADSKKSSEQSSAKLQKAIESVDAKIKNDLTPKILQAYEQQSKNLDHVLSNLKTITKKIPDKFIENSEFQLAKSDTLKYLDKIQKQLTQVQDIQTNTAELRKLAENIHKAIEAVDIKTRFDVVLNIAQTLDQHKLIGDEIVTQITNLSNKLSDINNDKDVRSDTVKSLQYIKSAIDGQTSHFENILAGIQRRGDENNAHFDRAFSEMNTRSSECELRPAMLQAMELEKQNSEKILLHLQTIANQYPNTAENFTIIQNAINRITNEVIVRTSLIQDKLNVVEKSVEINNDILYKTVANSITNKTGCELKPQISQVIELQKANFDDIVKNIQSVSDKLFNVDLATNNALHALSQVGNQCVTNYDLISKRLEEVHSATAENTANTNGTLELLTKSNLQPTILQVVQAQNTKVEEILTNIKAIPVSPLINPEVAKNETLQSLQQVKDDILGQGVLLTNKITALHALSEKNNENLQKTIVESGEMAEQLNANVASSFEKLSNSVRSLSKLDQLMVQTSDAVLDTKRRVEYGVHQIVLDVTNVIKKHSKDLNSTINLRFDDFELSLLQPQTGALNNLTTKIANEIDQVWRQISIMHQQMGANTDTLERIQSQTDVYINGSASTMDNMRGKVVQITTSMAEVEDNLNYLLGRLSLVTQEFNRIKSGLGEALDQIKGSFNTVQQKLRENGPGPHQIDSNEQQGVLPNPPAKPANFRF